MPSTHIHPDTQNHPLFFRAFSACRYPHRDIRRTGIMTPLRGEYLSLSRLNVLHYRGRRGFYNATHKHRKVWSATPVAI